MSKRTIDSFFSKAPKIPKNQQQPNVPQARDVVQQRVSDVEDSIQPHCRTENEQNKSHEVTTSSASHKHCDPNGFEKSSCSESEPACNSKKTLSTKNKTDLKESKAKVILQKFKDEWINSEEFLCFERYGKDPHYAFCKICLDKLCVGRGGKSNLTTHLQTKRHREAAIKISKSDCPNIEEYTIGDKVSEAELKISGWAVEHNIPFAAVDKLADVLRTIDPESKVFPMIRLGRTKTSSVISGVIAKSQHDELVEVMKTTDFSIMVDESTDLGTVKTLAIVVRTFDESKFEAKDIFYRSVELHCADHKSIYNAIVGEFAKDGINYKQRMKGFASDGASVMMGKENSVMRLFKKDCPNLVVVKCTCHSLALCASYACSQIPDYIEHLMKDIYSYLSHSPKRTNEFNMIQEILELKPLKILNSSSTRWLSLEAVVSRNLERFDELKMFFSSQFNHDRNQTAGRILNHMNDPMTKPVLLFLNYVLPMINRLNRTFQAEAPEFTQIYSETRTLYLTLLNNVCEEQYMKDMASKSDFRDFEQHLKTPKDIYIGIEAAAAEAKQLDDNRKLMFRSICCKFYVELIKQIEKRFNLKDDALKAASLIDVSKIGSYSTLHDVTKHYPFFLDSGNEQDLENEFRELKTKLICGDAQTDATLTSQENWAKLVNVKRGDGSFAYPTLRRFIIKFLIIPHSSASVERIFSVLNANKTKVRNRLNTQSMDSILKAKAYVAGHGGCQNIKLTKQMKSKMSSTMYKQHQAKID